MLPKLWSPIVTTDPSRDTVPSRTWKSSLWHESRTILSYRIIAFSYEISPLMYLELTLV